MEGRGNDQPLEAGSASYRGSLRCANSPGTIAHWLVPAGQKGGRDRPPVLARLIMPLRSRYRAVRIAQLSVAAGRDQRTTRAVRAGRNEGRSLPSALVACQDGSRGVSTSYLVTLLSARKKEMFVAKFVLDIKVPMEGDAASAAFVQRRAPALDQIGGTELRLLTTGEQSDES